jgi:hypothetical protein
MRSNPNLDIAVARTDLLPDCAMDIVPGCVAN